MACQYKDILGVPGEGFHKQRIFGFALLDIIGTIVAGYVISRMMISRFTLIKFVLVVTMLFLAGTLLHILFCVDTSFVKMLKYYSIVR